MIDLACDSGPADRVLIHRWRKPVLVGAKCCCGEREADVITARAINGPNRLGLAIFDNRGRPCRKTGERPMTSKKHGRYILVSVRFLDGQLPKVATMPRSKFEALKVIRGGQALVWDRVDGLIMEGMDPVRALQQAQAELNKGILTEV